MLHRKEILQELSAQMCFATVTLQMLMYVIKTSTRATTIISYLVKNIFNKIGSIHLRSIYIYIYIYMMLEKGYCTNL